MAGSEGLGLLVSGDRRLTRADLFDRAARVASGLKSLGIGRDDAVALCLRNDFAAFEVSFGAALIGACPVAVNWHFTVEEARYIFEDCGAKAIVIHADLAALLRPSFPSHATILIVDTPEEVAAAYDVAPSDDLILNSDLRWGPWRDAFAPLQGGSAELPRTIIYTSGTTGKPKGVRFAAPTAQQLDTRLRVARRGFGFLDYVDKPEEVVALLTGPIYHSAPNGYALQAIRLGATLIMQPRFDPQDFCRLVDAFRVTHAHLVPVMFVRLLALSEEVRARYDLATLRFAVHAAAPCPPQVKQAMIDWWGPVIHEYYGGTETSIVTACDSAEWLAHPGTVGRAIPEAEVRILRDDGYEAAVGDAGEIVCRIAGLPEFIYLKDPDKRREVDHGGCVALGDIGYFDADRYLYICDRSRDMIISGGVNIYPAELEAALVMMPGVTDCAVFGIPDDAFGESICAYVQPYEDIVMEADEVRDYLRTRLAAYKIPRIIEFRSYLPREDSGKIFKRKLRAPYWETINRKI